ncbi:hypothetical protein [Burkholderia pyrrocinia]|uniref:hypothetical protein n=1 Tax=Burkholderia pyrrocinia TaxID=60550 RepID=UPI001BCC565F|nr:hypothetical protein [Burkholderia pyrrocinia]QVN18809.1 hypothetical protein JYG32_03480 [Burkholderia pyrrocinia]
MERSLGSRPEPGPIMRRPTTGPVIRIALRSRQRSTFSVELQERGLLGLRALRFRAFRHCPTTAGTNATIQFLSDINRRIETSLPIISPPDIADPLSNFIKSHILPTRVIIAIVFSIEYRKIYKTLLTSTFPKI